MGLEKGNIVTVIDPDMVLHNKQGIIIDVKDDGDAEGPYCVRFGRSCESFFGWQTPRENVVRYGENQLRKDDRWEITNWAGDIYGNQWHHASSLRMPWTPENECMHEDHGDESAKSTGRILVNCWGTVYEIDVCDQHKHLHGKCGESLLIRKVSVV